MKTFRSRINSRRAGSVLILVAAVVSSVAFLAFAMMITATSANKRVREARESAEAMYVCDAGLSEAVFDLANGGVGDVGGKQGPVGFGKQASYWVAAVDLGGGMTQLTATGSVGRTSARVELVVRPVVISFFNWAAFGDEGMTMDANSMVDSYDSSDGTYDSQETNGNGNKTYANEKGDVGSNLDIELSVNSGVHGGAQPGVAGTVTLNGNKTFVTGSTTPAISAVVFPPIVVPVIPSVGSMTVGNTTIPSGSHGFDDLTVNGDLTIVGPATLLMTNFEIRSNSTISVDATNGSVEFFVVDDFVVGSNTSIASLTFDPADVQLNLISDNVIDPTTNVEFNSNSQIYGTIYAPNAAIDINSNFELFGSVIARRVNLASNSKIHFDENLNSGGGGGGASYETICWRLLPNL